MKHFLLFFCLLFSAALPAQMPYFRHLTNENGLPSNENYRVYPAQNGYLWISGEGGLVRYDGKEFHRYLCDKQISNSLTGVLEDFKGRIWVHDFTGRIFYAEGDSLKYFALWNPQKSSGHVYLNLEQGKYLYVHANQELYIYDIATLPAATLVYTSPHFHVLGLHGLQVADKYYFYTDSAIFCLQNRKNLTKIGIDKQLLHNGITSHSTFFTHQGNTYTLYIDVANRWQQAVANMTAGKTARWQKLPNVSLINYVVSIDNYVWLCTNQGLWKAKMEQDSLIFLENYRSQDLVSFCAKDKEGNFWFSTLKNGIFAIPNPLFAQIQLPVEAEKNKISAFNRSEKGILVGLNDGRVYLYNETGFAPLQSQVRNHYNSCSYLKDNTLYYCSDGIWQKNLQTQQEKKMYENPGIVGMYEGFGNSFLYCSANFGAQVNPNAIPPFFEQSILATKGNDITFLGERVRAFVVFPGEKKIIFAAKSGLYEMTEKGKKALTYQDSAIFAIRACLRKDKVWAATISKGLYTITEDNKVEHVSFPPTQAKIKIREMAVSDSYIWLLSDEQLFRFQPETQKWDIFDRFSSGLPLDLVEYIQTYKGKIHLAKGSEIIFFDENIVPEKPLFPAIHLQKILWNEAIFPVVNGQDFPYTTDNFSVEVAGISFRANGIFRFAYQLEGVNDKWIIANQNQTRVGFGRLDNGKYTLKIAPVNALGEIEAAQSYTFTILAPWWKKAWFYLPLILLIKSVLYVIYKNRLNDITERSKLLLAQEKLEKDLQSSQLSAIKSQMNPHFIFNALNTIQNFIYQNEPDRANFFLTRFSQLMRSILDMSNSDTVTLAEEIEALELYLQLEKMRFGEELFYEIKIANNLVPEYVKIPSMLIQPYVENAIKHGLLHKNTDRKLWISFEKEPAAFLKIRVEDNGIGIAKSMEINQKRGGFHKSYALAANRKRLEILNAQGGAKINCEIQSKYKENGEADGTIVELRIPFVDSLS